MLAPKLYNRDLKAILKDLVTLYNKFVPELKQEDLDAGSALLRIFAHIANKTLIRLNNVPDKAFFEFLDLLWTELHPPRHFPCSN